MTQLLDTAAVLAIGLLAGSLVVEAFVLVPFWRSLGVEDFYSLHHRVGPRLFSYFAPLTTVAVVAVIVAAVAGRDADGSAWRWAAAASSVVVLGFFPLYFKRANQALANRSVSDAQLPIALRQWSRVHAVRTVVAVGAFGFASMAGAC